MATACASSEDFDTDSGGRLVLNPATAQNAAVSFSHLLDGVDGTYEIVAGMPAVVVPRDGLYLLSWDAHGSVIVPPQNPGIALNARCMAGISVGGVFQVGTETMVCSVNLGGSPSVDHVAEGAEGTGSGSRVIQLTAGQVIRLMGAQDGNAAPINTFIQSGPDGRSRITLVRIAS